MPANNFLDEQIMDNNTNNNNIKSSPFDYAMDLTQWQNDIKSDDSSSTHSIKTSPDYTASSISMSTCPQSPDTILTDDEYYNEHNNKSDNKIYDDDVIELAEIMEKTLFREWKKQAIKYTFNRNEYKFPEWPQGTFPQIEDFLASDFNSAMKHEKVRKAFGERVQFNYNGNLENDNCDIDDIMDSGKKKKRMKIKRRSSHKSKHYKSSSSGSSSSSSKHRKKSSSSSSSSSSKTGNKSISKPSKSSSKTKPTASSSLSSSKRVDIKSKSQSLSSGSKKIRTESKSKGVISSSSSISKLRIKSKSNNNALINGTVNNSYGYGCNYFPNINNMNVNMNGYGLNGYYDIYGNFIAYDPYNNYINNEQYQYQHQPPTPYQQYYYQDIVDPMNYFPIHPNNKLPEIAENTNDSLSVPHSHLSYSNSRNEAALNL